MFNQQIIHNKKYEYNCSRGRSIPYQDPHRSSSISSSSTSRSSSSMIILIRSILHSSSFCIGWYLYLERSDMEGMTLDCSRDSIKCLRFSPVVDFVSSCISLNNVDTIGFLHFIKLWVKLTKHQTIDILMCTNSETSSRRYPCVLKGIFKDIFRFLLNNYLL